MSASTPLNRFFTIDSFSENRLPPFGMVLKEIAPPKRGSKSWEETPLMRSTGIIAESVAWMGAELSHLRAKFPA
jgi:hypothetical protein